MSNNGLLTRGPPRVTSSRGQTFANNIMKMTISFRFLALTPKQGQSLTAAIPKSELGRHFKTGKVVGCVPLNNRTKAESIIAFASTHGLKSKMCDILVSVSTDRDTLILDVPNIVNQIIKALDCQMTFSFTVT